MRLCARIYLREIAFEVLLDLASPRSLVASGEHAARGKPCKRREWNIGGQRRESALIFDDVLKALEGKRSPVIPTERKDHALNLSERLSRLASNVILLTGGMSVRQRQAVMQHLVQVPPEEERVLIATGRYIGEGFDDARLDTLFLAMPISWKGTLAQYVGRLHRLHPGKREVLVYDYIDEAVPVLARMSEKRIRGYRSLGYSLGRKEEAVDAQRLEEGGSAFQLVE